MTQDRFEELSRKAMIKYYMELRDETISVLDAANAIYSFIEQHYDNDPELQERLESYDKLVDNLKI